MPQPIGRTATPSADPRQIEFVERMGRLLEVDGLSRIAGRLFGALLLASSEESLDDLAAHLNVSKASVSVNARLLEQRGLIELASRPGDRRDFYRMTPDLFSPQHGASACQVAFLSRGADRRPAQYLPKREHGPDPARRARRRL